MAKTPNVIAQAVLTQLRVLGRVPTPEHYADLYCQLAGVVNPFDRLPASERQPAHDAKVPDISPLCRELLDMLQGTVDGAARATENLSQDLGERNGDLSRNVDTLRRSHQRDEILQLLTLIVTQAHGIQHSVDSGHKELVKTRQTLQSMRKELSDTRRQLNEDALTGALNRRGMDQALLREVARSQRNKTPLTLAMLDIDHFKQINDKHGHLVGDQALVHFAALARSVLRGTDVFVRYGGEEFALVLPETDMPGAKFLLTRLQKVALNSPLHVLETDIAMTFSAGLAQYRDDENGHALLHRADEALYQAKQAGRDRIVVAE